MTTNQGVSAVTFTQGQRVRFQLLGNRREEGGDGTVAIHSGAGLQNATPTPARIFEMKGFDHQSAFGSRVASTRWITVWSIAQILKQTIRVK